MYIPINQAARGRKSWRTDSSHAIYERGWRNISHILSAGSHCVTCQRYFRRNVPVLTLACLCILSSSDKVLAWPFKWSNIYWHQPFWEIWVTGVVAFSRNQAWTNGIQFTYSSSILNFEVGLMMLKCFSLRQIQNAKLTVHNDLLVFSLAWPHHAKDQAMVKHPPLGFHFVWIQQHCLKNLLVFHKTKSKHWHILTWGL